ncbi:hypothetical protein AAX26_01636 [Aliarcobacter thereius]|uniref:hypothetical protein n=1 Tax=Aliarcobacter thereius TaxID=544718 RepID=UPI000827FB66|nr:hypothetical protein [Aliarcobacter thereius]OCL85987.1 hypothetical protein AAX26_01636 [Aliarcobacter thereius]
MHNFTYFYDKLLNFYGVTSLQGLSNETKIPISTISSIKQRESITALKKKCRELGIYNEIFGDLNLSSSEDKLETISKSKKNLGIDDNNKWYSLEEAEQLEKKFDAIWENLDSFIKINKVLLEKAEIEASKFGLDINSYIEYLIIQDLKK